MNIEEIVGNMIDNLINNPVLGNKVAYELDKDSNLDRYSMDELSQLIVDTAKLLTQEKNNKIVASLDSKLAIVANAGLASANRGNPFWSKRDAMQAINGSRNLIRSAK